MKTIAKRVRRCSAATRSRVQRGTTLIELLVVVGIMIVVFALALPSMMNVIGNSRVRNGMGNIANLYQAARMMAVKQNAVFQVRFVLSQGRWVAYVDSPEAAETTVTAGITVKNKTSPRPQIVLPTAFAKAGDAPSGGANTPSALDAATMWGSGAHDFTPDAAHDTSFSALGLPCVYASGACATGSTGFVYYFTYAPSTLGSTSWAALGVSPAGRVKVWYWDGTAWKN